MESLRLDVCNICLEDITQETGKIITSCNHLFHYYCLTSWFYKEKIQLEETFPLFIPSSCPCCRKKFSKIEDLPTKQDLGLDMDIESQDESLPLDDDDQTQTDDEIQESEEEPEERYIDFSRFWYVNLTRVRLGVELTETNREFIIDPFNDPSSIATKIKAIWKGYRIRKEHSLALTLLQMKHG